MILLDTNIISELMKPTPAKEVVDWIDQQSSSALTISTITMAEIEYGIGVLPDGSRRQKLEEAFQHVLQEAFKHRILPFDESSARFYEALMSRRKSLGRPLGILDGQIAAIARAHQASLATRNTKDFEDCDLDLINPFQRMS